MAGAAPPPRCLTVRASFASTWNLLFVAYANTGAVQSQLDAINHAYALRSRLSEFEALATAARCHRLHGDFAEEETAWQRLVEAEREQTNYANMLLERRSPAEAEAVQRRDIDADSNLAIGYWNLTEAQVAQRKFAAAESTVARMTARLPDARLTQ